MLVVHFVPLVDVYRSTSAARWTAFVVPTHMAPCRHCCNSATTTGSRYLERSCRGRAPLAWPALDDAAGHLLAAAGRVTVLPSAWELSLETDKLETLWTRGRASHPHIAY